MRVRVLQKAYYYDRRMWAVGEELDIDDREDANVDILAKMGQLEIVVPTSRSGIGYKTAAMKAGGYTETAAIKAEPVVESVAVDEREAAEPVTAEDNPLAEGGEPKKYYRRRDMRAEK